MHNFRYASQNKWKVLKLVRLTQSVTYYKSDISMLLPNGMIIIFLFSC